MKFKDKYVSGEFLAEIYDNLLCTKSLLRSDLYDEPSGIIRESL